MKRTIYLLAFLWAFMGQLNAQFDVEVKFGELGKLTPPIFSVQLESGQFIYAKKVGSAATVVFDLLDDQMNILKSVESDLVFKYARSKPEKNLRAVEFWGGKLYAFYSTNKGGVSYMVYAEEIDQATLKLSGTPIAIGDFEKKGQIEYGEKMHFIKSMDEQRLLIYLKEIKVKNESNGRNEYLQMMVLDEALDMQWQKGLLVSGSEGKNVYLDVVVNNAGEVFVLGQEVIGNIANNATGRYPDYDNYTLYKFDRRGTQRLSKKLKLGERKSRRLNLSMGPKEDLLVSGAFFTEQGENGILYIRFDSLGLRIQRTAFNLIDPEFIVQGYSISEVQYVLKENSNGNPYNLPISVREVVHRPDGGVIILGERFREVRAGSSSGFIFGEIFILHLDEEGDLDWKRKIMKKQDVANGFHSPERGLYTCGSFTYAIQGDYIILLFNDHEQNVELDRSYGDVKNANSRGVFKNAFHAVGIDNAGNMKREKLFLSSEQEVLIYPSCSKPLNKQRTEFILFGKYKSKNRLAHLVVE
jgi:hypothetical protein